MKNHIINVVTGNGTNAENVTSVLIGVAITIISVMLFGHASKF